MRVSGLAWKAGERGAVDADMTSSRVVVERVPRDELMMVLREIQPQIQRALAFEDAVSTAEQGLYVSLWKGELELWAVRRGARCLLASCCGWRSAKQERCLSW
jgi:hypothetical protein